MVGFDYFNITVWLGTTDPYNGMILSTLNRGSRGFVFAFFQKTS